MGIKRLFRYATVLLILWWFASGCRSDKNVIDGIPVTNYYDSCYEFHDFGDLTKVGDPQDKFMIALPYSWDTRYHYTDTLYTIVAANFMSIPIDLDQRMSITASGYTTQKNLEKYYRDELKQLKKDKNIDVEETGSTLIDGLKSFWIKFVQHIDEHRAFNLVMYVKKEDSQDIYLIQSTVYDPVNYNEKLCYMKRLINSFEIEDDQ